MMTRKRLLCAALALAMLLSAQSAAAAAETENTRSMIITANTRLPKINVTVPGKGSVYINPLSLTVSINGKPRKDQIFSTPCALINRSEVPLAVDVTVTGSALEGSDLQLSTSSTAGSDGGDKRAFVYFEIQPSPTADTDLVTSRVTWDAAYDSEKHIVVDGTPEGRTRTNVLTLAAKTQAGEVARGGCAAFRLSGDVVPSPEQAWTTKDGVEVKVAFSFTPLPYS